MSKEEASKFWVGVWTIACGIMWGTIGLRIIDRLVEFLP